MEGKINKTDVKEVANSDEHFNHKKEENQKSVILNCLNNCLNKVF